MSREEGGKCKVRPPLSLSLHYNKIEGRNNDNCGMKVTSINITNMAHKNGVIDFTSSSRDTSATPVATNKLAPKGGVQKPIAKLTVIMTPKWTGSIPIPWTIGSKIGVRMIMEAIVSMNIPTIRSIIFISNSMINGFSDTEVIMLATSTGTRSRVSSRPNEAAITTITSTVAEVSPDFRKTLLKSLSFKSR